MKTIDTQFSAKRNPPGLINLPATWNLAPVGIIISTGASRKDVEENLKSWEDNTEEAKSVIEIIMGKIHQQVAVSLVARLERYICKF